MLASAMWVVISQCLTGSELSIRNLQPFVFGDLLQYGTGWRKDDVNQCLEFSSRVKALSLVLLGWEDMAISPMTFSYNLLQTRK